MFYGVPGQRVVEFPISRDPPEGGTFIFLVIGRSKPSFQFVGIPPKGEPNQADLGNVACVDVSNF